jgi:nucleoside-diphosphate-sugar epimerase
VNALVTGAAGFVGSHLSEQLVGAGVSVRGVDCYTPYYERERKERNLEALHGNHRFEFVVADLFDADLVGLLDGIDVVYHLAAQPGVRKSWGRDFATYVRCNIDVTQRLLEACRTVEPAKIVYASSSSVYGDAEALPTREDAIPRPVSPYGVTKLAAEHLCEVYRTVYRLPAASLRLFSVYGPRQRPDMAFARLVRAAVRGERFTVFGDGEQTRDFTYVGDAVQGLVAASRSEWCGVANIGGGARTSMNEVITIVESLCGPIDIVRGPAQDGDARHTGADTTRARDAFGYAPTTSLTEGLAAMVEWERAHREVAA